MSGTVPLLPLRGYGKLYIFQHLHTGRHINSSSFSLVITITPEARKKFQTTFHNIAWDSRLQYVFLYDVHITISINMRSVLISCHVV